MTLNERHNAILEILKQNRTANVKKLAERLFVSDATIRRDLKEMQALGLIERSHGGAILPDNAEEVSIFVRMNKNAKAKEQVATNALPLLPEFHSVFIDSSSTALALAGRMDLSFKTVVTNNLQTALQLSKNANVNLILLGGNVQFSSVSSTGSWTARQIEEFSFDLMLTSCAAIQNGEALDRSLEQKEIKLAAFKRSKKRILLADRSKFTTDGNYKIAALEDFDLVITD
jgi:DeoR/GlpR family transcriptional regulator of sugar metabolism